MLHSRSHSRSPTHLPTQPQAPAQVEAPAAAIPAAPKAPEEMAEAESAPPPVKNQKCFPLLLHYPRQKCFLLHHYRKGVDGYRTTSHAPLPPWIDYRFPLAHSTPYPSPFHPRTATLPCTFESQTKSFGRAPLWLREVCLSRIAPS